MTTVALIVGALATVLGLACGGRVAPATRYYQLAAPTSSVRGGDAVIVLEPLATEAGYDDERMVYRTSAYRFDYYAYHRWSAAPGTLVSSYLAEALRRSGQVRAVLRDLSPDASVILTGRVIAIEEIDLDPEHWVGHLVLALHLIDARTDAVLWSDEFDEREPVRTRSPEGLAQALSAAMARISRQVAPRIAAVADHQHRLNATVLASPR